MQPRIQRLPQIRIAQRSIRAPTLCVSTNHHLPHLEVRNSKLHHTRRIDIVRMHRVGNITMHEDIPGLTVADRRFRNPTIRAPYPEYLGRLAFGKVDKGIRVSLGCASGVYLVAGEEVVKRI